VMLKLSEYVNTVGVMGKGIALHLRLLTQTIIKHTQRHVEEVMSI
jgi:hypothetical protein